MVSIKSQFRLLYTSIYFAIGALTSLLVLYLETIGFSGTQTGMIMAAGSLVLIFSQPFWGVVCDKTQKTLIVLRLTLIMAGLLAVVLAYIYQFYLFLIIYCLMHFFQGANAPISDTLAINASNKEGSNFGALRQYGAIGFAIAVFIVSNVSEYLGLNVIFFFYFFAYFIPAIFFRAKIEVTDRKFQMNLLTGLKALVKIPEFKYILTATFFIFGPIVANNNYFSLLFRHSGGSLAGVGIAFLLFAGSEAPFMKLSNQFVKKIGIENTLIAASFISMIRWFWYASGPSPEFMLGLFLLQGLSVGVYIVTAAQFVTNHSIPELRVTAMTIYSSAGIGLGGIFCQMMGGVLLDQYNVLTIYKFFGISSIIGLFCLYGIKNKKKACHPNLNKC